MYKLTYLASSSPETTTKNENSAVFFIIPRETCLYKRHYLVQKNCYNEALQMTKCCQSILQSQQGKCYLFITSDLCKNRVVLGQAFVNSNYLTVIILYVFHAFLTHLVPMLSFYFPRNIRKRLASYIFRG